MPVCRRISIGHWQRKAVGYPSGMAVILLQVRRDTADWTVFGSAKAGKLPKSVAPLGRGC